MKNLLLSFLLMFLPILVNADPIEIDGILYNLISKGNIAEVTKGNIYSGEVVIPDKISFDNIEYTVSVIGNYAFSESINLTSITIPASVKSIGTGAFQLTGSWGYLTSVHISDIGAWCDIKFADYDSNPLHRAQHLYLNDEEIGDLIIPNGVKSIGDYAFSGYKNLKSVTFPNSVTSIGSYAFNNCLGLSSVIISDLESWCKISFGNGYSNPLNNAHHLYLNGEEVKDVVLPDKVTSICNYAFQSCSSISSVIIPNSVTSIGNCAFENCTSIVSISIGNGVTSIGNSAFYNCIGLTSITIPNSVMSLGISAFKNCSNLTFVLIPNSVTSISDYAFQNCSSLSSITIPQNVLSISNYAFRGCEKITDVYCMNEQVRGNLKSGKGLYSNPNAFIDSYQEYITLHVPATSVEAYKALEPWKNFKDVVALNSEDIPEIPKCATPTISIVDGKITFNCETEGVEYISEVTVSDAKKYYDNEISAPKKFKVSVYAVKANHENSETTTAEFDFLSFIAMPGDVNGDGDVNVADHVKLTEIIMNKTDD